MGAPVEEVTETVPVEETTETLPEDVEVDGDVPPTDDITDLG